MINHLTKICKGIIYLALWALPATGFSQTQVNRPQANHQALCVKNLDTSSKFYTEVMLLIKMDSPFNNDVIQWFKTGPQTELHLIKGNCGAEHYRNVHMAFSVASMNDFMKHLDKHNINYSSSEGNKKAQTRGDGIKQIYLQDPDGYWIEINDVK